MDLVVEFFVFQGTLVPLEKFLESLLVATGIPSVLDRFLSPCFSPLTWLLLSLSLVYLTPRGPFSSSYSRSCSPPSGNLQHSLFISSYRWDGMIMYESRGEVGEYKKRALGWRARLIGLRY